MSRNDEVRIDVTVENAEALRKFDATDAAIKKVKLSAGDMASGIAAGAAGIAGAAAAVVAFSFKVAELNAQFETSQRAATLLGSAYAQVELSTRGAVSAQTALRAQQTLVQSGLQLTGAQLGVVTRAARDYALATGVETTQAMEQLTDALRTGSSEGLGRFGIAIADTGSRASNFTNALNTLATAQSGQSAAALTSAESLDRFKTGLTFLGGEIASFLAGQGSGLLQWVTTIGERSNSSRYGLTGLIAEISERAGVAAGNATGAAASAAGDARRERTQRTLRGLRGVELSPQQAQMLGVRGIGNLPEQEQEMISVGFRNLAGDVESSVTRIMQARNTAAMAAMATADTANKAREASKRAARGTGGASGGGGARTTRVDARRFHSVDEIFEELRASIARDDESLIRLGGTASDTRQVSEDDFASTLGTLASGRSMTDDANSDRANRRANRDQATRRGAMAQDTSLGGGMMRRLGVTDDAIGDQAKAWQGYSDTAVGAIGKVTQAFGTHLAAVIAGREGMGEALLAGANEVTSALAIEALPKAAMELAAGIAAASSLIPPVMATAPGHFASAAVYGSVAALAGLTALGTGAAMTANAPAGGGAGSVAAAKSASGRSIGGSEKGSGNTTIVISSLVPPGPQELQGLVRASRQAGRYGMTAPSPRQVRI